MNDRSDGLEVAGGIAPAGATFRTLLAQARPLHWGKNLIVAVPLLTSQQFFHWEAWPGVILAFVALCLAASAGYQHNDLSDIEADRVHPIKSARPLASGALSPGTVAMFGLALGVGALAVAAAVGLFVLSFVAGYMALSALYSTLLKRMAVMDVLALAVLYCVRIFAGAAAIAVAVSPYLLGFSLIVFVSLALMKRFITLTSSANGEAAGVYGKGDATLLLIAGVTMAVASAGYFALYINDPLVRARYSAPDMLWGVWLLLLYALLRGWLFASRGQLKEDLATAAIRDSALWGAAVAAVSLFLLAY